MENVTTDVPWNEAAKKNVAQAKRTADAPLPSTKTLKRRKRVISQLGKFIAFNMRFMMAFFEEESRRKKELRK